MRFVQFRKCHCLDDGRCALSHCEQDGLRDECRTIAIPGVGTVDRTHIVLNVASAPASDSIDPGLQLPSIRVRKAPSPIGRKVPTDS